MPFLIFGVVETLRLSAEAIFAQKKIILLYLQKPRWFRLLLDYGRFLGKVWKKSIFDPKRTGPLLERLCPKSPLVRFWGRTQTQIRTTHLVEPNYSNVSSCRIYHISSQGLEWSFRMLVVFLTSERNVSSVVFFLKLMIFFFLVREPKFLGLSGFHQVSSPFRLDAFLTFKSQNIGRGY